MSPLAAALKETLALVLVAAGAAKLADLPGFAAALSRLGVARAAGRFALFVCAVEVGLGLASFLYVWPEAINLAVLFCAGGFVAVNVYGILRLPDLRCRCFGTLSASRFGKASLARACAMVIAAAFVLWRDPYPTGLSASYLALLAPSAVLLGVLALQAARAAEIWTERSPTS